MVKKKDTQRNTSAFLSAIGALGNFSSHIQFTKQNLNEMYEALEPLLDSQDETIRDEVTRVISNQIGIGKEWSKNDYKASYGLDRF
jgi:hypothetical protein